MNLLKERINIHRKQQNDLHPPEYQPHLSYHKVHRQQSIEVLELVFPIECIPEEHVSELHKCLDVSFEVPNKIR